MKKFNQKKKSTNISDFIISDAWPMSFTGVSPKIKAVDNLPDHSYYTLEEPE